MGCNKSLAQGLYKENQDNLDWEVLRAIQKNYFITQRTGPITDYYEILKIIGSHDEYTIYHAREIESGNFRLIKEVTKCQKDKLCPLKHEIKILSDIDHPNILKIFETIDSPRSLYIIYEYPNGGDIKSRIRKTGQEVAVAKFMMDTLAGLLYLHKNNYVHGDIQLDNLVLTEESGEMYVKIMGFSIARKQNDLFDETETPHISIVHSAPEFLQGKFDPKIDLWSVGIITYTLLVGKIPYEDVEDDELIDLVRSASIDYRNPSFHTISTDAKDFIRKLLVVDPKKRMSAEDALNHIWIQQNRKKTSLTYDTVYRLKTFRVKSNIVRCFLIYYNFKMNLKENDIIRFFKEIDQNFDGTVSKDELVYAFAQVGINVDKEIDSIMNNIDMDQSGLVDFSELKIVLTDWDREIKKKNIAKIFNVVEDFIDLTTLKNGLDDILPSEWENFCIKTQVEDEKVHIQKLKEFIRSNIE
ncbi:hypothetical protein SteCoe_35582 [Stentor coeruleus]|uniref:Uncharacterized protein n=1 Tax=Stentor coeruleus TaxID=5963 RepID=A0A1R2AS70_9CILI|nr:hypothetical protein SteCoe_35582 [Stentor coeruleus]